MLRHSRFLVALTVLACSIGHCDDPQIKLPAEISVADDAAKPSDATKPFEIKLSDPKTDHLFHFGTGFLDETISRTILVVNDTDNDVLIGNLRTSCKCTTTKLDDKSIKAGDNKEIGLTLLLKTLRTTGSKVAFVAGNREFDVGVYI